jgi:hypothetical protein
MVAAFRPDALAGSLGEHADHFSGQTTNMNCARPARPNHDSNLVSRGHGIDIVPVFIEHGPPEFPCPTQNKKLNENNPLRVVGPPTTDS